MKNVFLFFLILPSILIAQDSTLSGIRFVTGLSWEQILSKAKGEGKYIFVDCYTTWCGPCKKMDRETYTHFRAGYAMNDKYISLKIQMDSTGSDNEEVKRWYSTVSHFKGKYQIDAYPTFLFFSPDGKLVHKDAGFRGLQEFIQLSEVARHPQKTLYYSQYDDYKRGKKDFINLGQLAVFTKTLIKEYAVASRMAFDYKKHVLDNRNRNAYSKYDLDFVSYYFPEVVNSKDIYFWLAYNNPIRFDSIRKVAGAAKTLVNTTINREEIESRLLKNGTYKIKEPDWSSIQMRISRKYNQLDAKKLVLEYKVQYYRDKFKDWQLWAKYKDELIKAYPPKPPYGINDVYVQINGWGGAWLAFMRCNDSTVLKKALEWADLALLLQPEWKDAYLDTKANILYKLGKTEDAIKYQEEAVLAAKNDDTKKEYQNTVQLMKKGQHTYLDQGAVWDSKTLPIMK